jgi:hypothetical protein
VENYPVFLKTPSTRRILHEVASLIPEGTQVYLFGGAVRNAVYYNYFNEEMTQRDFDCIVIGDGETFAQNLSNAGYVYGQKNSEKTKVLKKARIPNPEHQYDDWLYLDCKIYPDTEDIQSILERISDFTISGVALDLKDVESEEWENKIISIPNALEDIHQKKLRVIKPYAISFHKIIRMVSRGFQKPSQEDIDICFEKLKEITEDKFITNTEKTIRYVGDREEVLEITKNLGVHINILNFSELKNSAL